MGSPVRFEERRSIERLDVNIMDCSGGLNSTCGDTAGRAGSGCRFRFNPGFCWVFGILSFGIGRWWGWLTVWRLLSRCCCLLPGRRFVFVRAVDLDPVDVQQTTFQAGARLALFIAFLIEKWVNPQVADTERQQDFFSALTASI